MYLEVGIQCLGPLRGLLFCFGRMTYRGRDVWHICKAKPKLVERWQLLQSSLTDVSIYFAQRFISDVFPKTRNTSLPYNHNHSATTANFLIASFLPLYQPKVHQTSRARKHRLLNRDRIPLQFPPGLRIGTCKFLS